MSVHIFQSLPDFFQMKTYLPLRVRAASGLRFGVICSNLTDVVRAELCRIDSGQADIMVMLRDGSPVGLNRGAAFNVVGPGR